MANKLLGLGTIMTIDGDTITLAVDGTPPTKRRVNVDGSTLTDDLATYEPGIEDFSDATFTQYWDPMDTDHLAIDALFDSKAAVTFTIQYTDTGTTTESFSAKVTDLEPETIVKDKLLGRKVTLHRVGSISRA